MEDESQNAENNFNSSEIIDRVIEMDGEVSINCSSIEDRSGSRRTSLEAPRVVILEQPMPSLRYRYKSEQLSAKIYGANGTTPTNRMYPTIQVIGFKGEAAVLVSCVTKDPPYRPHPHCLVGEDCRMGIFQKIVSVGIDGIVSFPGLNLQNTLKKEIADVLRQRRERNIDPFRTGFAHSSHPNRIDLDYVRLCFQVILEGNRPGVFERDLPPVVSEPIHNKKVAANLNIYKLSDASAPMTGGKEMMLFCDKVEKDDIEIKFFDEGGDWVANAIFNASDVHKGFGISFRTPKYKNCQVDQPVNVFVNLTKPSDGSQGEAVPFKLLPRDSYQDMIKRKKQRYDGVSGLINLPPTSSNKKPRPSFRSQHASSAQPPVSGSACAQRSLASPAVQRSKSDVVNPMPKMEQENLPRSYSVVEEPSHDRSLFQPSETVCSSVFSTSNVEPSHYSHTLPQHGVVHLQTGEILYHLPPIESQQQFSRMDHDLRLADMISELGKCVQPPDNDPRLADMISELGKCVQPPDHDSRLADMISELGNCVQPPDHDPTLADMISELGNCAQPAISSDQLVPHPSNFVSQVPQGSVETDGSSSGGVSSLERALDTSELQEFNEGLENLTEFLSSGLTLSSTNLVDMEK